MIIVYCNNYFPFVRGNNLALFEKNYFSSIEFIDNAFDDILVKETVHSSRIYYYNLQGKLHNPIGPAILAFFTSENTITKKAEYYFLNSLKHRLDGPAIIQYDKNGNIKEQEYFLNGKHYSIKEFEKAANDYSKH